MAIDSRTMCVFLLWNLQCSTGNIGPMKHAILVKHRYSNEFSSFKVLETELPPWKAEQISMHQSRCAHWIVPVQVAEWLPLSQASLLGNKISLKSPAVSHLFGACWGKVQHRAATFTKGKKKVVMSQPCPDCFPVLRPPLFLHIR